MTDTTTDTTTAPPTPPPFLPTLYGDLPEILTTDGQSIHGYPIRIPNSPDGPKLAVLRLPTSDELIEWFNQQKDLIKPLGRGISEEESVPTPKYDRKLFESIRLDKGSLSFDDAEALYALSQLTRHRVESVERDGQEYTVTLSTLFDVVTTHTVRIPYQAEIAKYQRDVVRVKSLANGFIEQRIMVAAAVSLYNQTVSKISGYQNGAGQLVTDIGLVAVPPHHKRTVIVKLMTEISLLDSSADPN